MISAFRMKFGRAASLPPELIETTPVTVFVGPNNSGKSKVLSEIEHYCRVGQKNNTFVILDDVTFMILPPDAAAEPSTALLSRQTFTKQSPLAVFSSEAAGDECMFH